jgi:hypothetical protein
MKPRNGVIVALLFLATCNEEAQKEDFPNIESGKAALGIVPPSEVAVWQKIGSIDSPEDRYLQAVAFDETRKVVVMFGGTNMDFNTGTATNNQETWEWNPSTGKWTNRTGTGATPDPRSGAAMVFDSARGKFVLFGGRAGSGLNYEDLWEWDPATGAWTELGTSGSRPSARSQHGMVYEKSTGKILLFGGGRSDTKSTDATGVSISFGDTWEFDPTANTWAAHTVPTSPSVRHDFGLVWDSVRKKAVLFGGISIDISGVSGVPKQDIWEWDPESGAWTERTVQGSKPSQRHAMGMAFDATRNKVVVFGGSDISSGGNRNDLWDWDPTNAAWTQRLAGTETGAPVGRMYSSMVSDEGRARLELIAGAIIYDPFGRGGGVITPGMGYGNIGTREVWELDPATLVYTDRTVRFNSPTTRYNHAMAYNPSTGRTYVFGGYDSTRGQTLDDFWEWDGKAWTQIVTDVYPSARGECAMAYDPARKSIILYGGTPNSGNITAGETWEFNSAQKWVQLNPASVPDAVSGHTMVTDTTRNKILLFGGMSNNYSTGPIIGLPYKYPYNNQVWEWDGTKQTWTNRTPSQTGSVPNGRLHPLLAYDSGRQKMFLYEAMNNYYYSSDQGRFWEWDPISAGWTYRDTGDSINSGYYFNLTYDSIRRRVVLVTDSMNKTGSDQETWELETNTPTWYKRTMSRGPGAKYGAMMTFDSTRGVAILFGGQNMNTGLPSSETWEYKVTNLGNGEGCNATFASSCASGFCVEGVCCDVAACTGACKSCNVAGSEGTCVMAKAGTEVPGSCSEGQACDGSGKCMSKNGQPCTSAANCASGFCADSVCCDGACTDTCVACNQAGQVGKCKPYTAGTDPQNECGDGTGACKSTCDGVGSCGFPQYTTPCGDCLTCDGSGNCNNYDPYCNGSGGTGGRPYPTGGTGGRPYLTGGSGGYVTGGKGGSGGMNPNTGGSGGIIIGGTSGTKTGGAGGRGGSGGSSVGGSGGGAGGLIPNTGGSGGSIPNTGGRDGGVPNLGGSGGNVTGNGGSGGSTIPIDGGIGNRDAGGGDASKTSLKKSGCDCEIGHAGQSPSLTTPLLLAGLALLLVRKRRRKG